MRTHELVFTKFGHCRAGFHYRHNPAGTDHSLGGLLAVDHMLTDYPIELAQFQVVAYYVNRDPDDSYIPAAFMNITPEPGRYLTLAIDTSSSWKIVGSSNTPEIKLIDLAYVVVVDTDTQVLHEGVEDAAYWTGICERILNEVTNDR